MNATNSYASLPPPPGLLLAWGGCCWTPPSPSLAGVPHDELLLELLLPLMEYPLPPFMV
jgi:hypothetical protein